MKNVSNFTPSLSKDQLQDLRGGQEIRLEVQDMKNKKSAK